MKKSQEKRGHRDQQMEGWFENKNEKVMGKDVEMDRHGRISKEQRELLQFKHTKHQNVV